MGVLSLLFPLLPKYRPLSSCSPLGLSSRSLLHLSTRDSPLAASLSLMVRQAVAVVGTELVRALLPSLPPQRARAQAQGRKPERGMGEAAPGEVASSVLSPFPFLFPVPYFLSPLPAFVSYSSYPHPCPAGGTGVRSWENPRCRAEGLCPCDPVQGEEGAGRDGAQDPTAGGSRLTSNSLPPTPPPPPIEAPEGWGRAGSWPEDRTSSWQDTGRQAGGSQPQSRPQGEKVTGSRGSPVPRLASVLIASPSYFKQRRQDQRGLYR